MKKILVVMGGGRPKGNTAQLVDSFVKGAEEAGHSVEKVSLLKTEVKGCLGCNACRYGKPCVQKDGFNELVPKIKGADLVVFASPLYFWTISSKLKAFIERFYCIAEEDSNPTYGRYERYPVKDSALLMTSVSMTGAWCWPAAAVIPTGSRRLIRRGTYRKRMNLGKIFIRNDIAGSGSDGCRQWTEKCMNMNP